jgi:hypothetical protein
MKPVGALQDLSPGPTGISSAVCWTPAHQELTMARFAHGRKLETARHSTPQSWNTLDELRQIALSQGCTPAQFKYAIEVMGNEPHHIARYLHRHEFAIGLSRETLQAV